MNTHELKDAIERVKTLTDLLPDPTLRTATETSLGLLFDALSVAGAGSMSVDEFREQVAEHLRRGWQSALEEKFGGHIPGDHEPTG